VAAGVDNTEEEAVNSFESCKWTHVEMLQCNHFDAKITFNPNKVVVVVVAAGDSKCAALCRKAVTSLEKGLGKLKESAQPHCVEGLVLNLDTSSPHLVQSLGALNVPSMLCFSAGNEIERLIGAPSLRGMMETLQRLSSARAAARASPPCYAAGPSVPVLRKDWNGVEGNEGDVFYFGIVDVLQPYTLKKQLEHSLKSLVQDKQKMTIVEPALYSQRFQAYISSILV